MPRRPNRTDEGLAPRAARRAIACTRRARVRAVRALRRPVARSLPLARRRHPQLYLAQSERAKAIIPLCVGLSATLAAFALLVPAIAAEMAIAGVSAQLMTEIYLICP